MSRNSTSLCIVNLDGSFRPQLELFNIVETSHRQYDLSPQVFQG
jgi:hypothetical protein